LSNSGALNLVFTAREFQPAADSFDESYKFVGPLIGSRPNPGDLPLESLSQHPIIYISLGTINNTNVAFYQACIAALRDHPGQVVLSAKTEIRAAIGSFPPNFIVRPYVAQLEGLPKVDLFITHGGMNSVQEGLMAGVPLLVVPQQQEQAIVAAQVAKHGAGIVLAGSLSGNFSPELIREAVQKILSTRPAYQESAHRLGETFRAAGGAKRAVAEIERYLKPSP
jgi:MGT family glycosyltransferase